MRKSEDWHDVPVIVSTAMELTAGDRDRLGDVADSILQKHASGLEGVMAEVHRILDHQARNTTKA